MTDVRSMTARRRSNSIPLNMSRAHRLLELIQLLRNHRYAVPGATLADQLGISVRTLYRDIATLQAQGADIEGEPGLGYVLRPGFMLPPLMFSAEEIEAIVLGSRWVAERGDPRIAEAARQALSKIAAVLPSEVREDLETSALLVGPSSENAFDAVDVAAIRRAIRTERKITIGYRDSKDVVSARTIWPFAMGYFDHVRIVMAWCESRDDFRHFRADRIHTMTVEESRYPRRRQALLKAWRAVQQVQR